jgi:predicted MFS family arabinose efflux permease
MIRSSNRQTRASTVPPPRATIAALSANLVGIGLARFGYTPLIPALIAAGWFAPSAAVYLGAANLAGYLAGALGARWIAARSGERALLRGAMLITAASLLGCALPWGFAWFFLWRFLSGGTDGVLMALAAPSVMPGIPLARRGLAGGMIFTGVGLGIAASGTLVPLLMRWGLAETWLGLGGLALVLTAIAWNGWPADGDAPLAQSASPRPPPATPALRALYLEYALNAVGLVPHMVFLVDFIARDLGQGLHEAAGYWVIFGAGALVGPLAAGHLGDRIGFRAALRLAFVMQALCVALPCRLSPWRRSVLQYRALSSARLSRGSSRSRSAAPANSFPTTGPTGGGLGVLHDRLRARAGDRRLWFRVHLRARRERVHDPVRLRRGGTAAGADPRFSGRGHHAASSNSRMTGGPSILRGLVWIQRSCIDNSAMRSS